MRQPASGIGRCRSGREPDGRVACGPAPATIFGRATGLAQTFARCERRGPPMRARAAPSPDTTPTVRGSVFPLRSPGALASLVTSRTGSRPPLRAWRKATVPGTFANARRLRARGKNLGRIAGHAIGGAPARSRHGSTTAWRCDDWKARGIRKRTGGSSPRPDHRPGSRHGGFARARSPADHTRLHRSSMNRSTSCDE